VPKDSTKSNTQGNEVPNDSTESNSPGNEIIKKNVSLVFLLPVW
jgi:hypothetical protein